MSKRKSDAKQKRSIMAVRAAISDLIVEVDRLAVDASDDLDVIARTALAVEGLGVNVASLDARVSKELASIFGRLDNMQDELTDAPSRTAELVHLALDASRNEGERATPAEQVNLPAVHALIATYDQLAVIADAVEAHADIIEGQRQNLLRTLEVLGVVPVLLVEGDLFDAQRARSMAAMVDTDDASLDQRVARTVVAGFERSNGTGTVRLPEVMVFRFLPPADTKTETETE